MPSTQRLLSPFDREAGTGAPPLTPSQRAAVEASAAPQLVIAGPGTGKTRVLVYRAAYMLTHPVRPIPSDELVVITFSTKAATQLRDRLHGLIGPEVQFVRAGTIHHFCYELVRAYHDRLGLPRHFLVADDAVTDAFWQPWCQRNGYAKQHRQVKTRVSRFKLGLDPLPRDLRHGLDEYRHMLLDRSALDFDDLLTYARDLLRDDADARRAVQQKIGALLVDEFQDTDPVQYYIIKSAVCPERQGLFCVADDDQSIYGFRGARPQNVRDFIRDFGCSREAGNLHVLRKNYRSNESIFRSAEAVLDTADRIKRHGEIDVARETNAPIEIVPCATERDEMRFVLQTLRRWIDEGVPRSEIAVLTPWNSLNASIEELLLREGIPCDVSGTGRLMETPVLRRLEALLQFLHRALHGQRHEAELETLLGHLLDQHAFGIVKGFQARLRGGGLNTAFQKLVLDEAARQATGLSDTDRQQLDSAYAVMTNLLGLARGTDVTVAELVHAALPKLDGPLQLLAQAEDLLRDPLSIPSLRFAVRPLRTWIERFRHAEPHARPRLVVHHPNRQIEALFAALVQQAFDEQGKIAARTGRAAPTLFDAAGDALSGGVYRLRDLAALRGAPLGTGDVVLTANTPTFLRDAKALRLLPPGDDHGYVILDLMPERAGAPGHDPGRAAVMLVDEEGVYESPAVRLFKLLQAALAADAAPLYPEYVMVDVETTGTDPLHCRAVEIGALRVIQGTVVGRFETLIALPDDLSPGERETLQTVCGFDLSAFEDAPSEAEAWRAFCAFAGASPLVAHNGQRFDFRVLDRLRRTHRASIPARWTIMHDMLPDAVELFPNRPSYRAEDLRRDLLGDTRSTSHRALADCEDQQRLLTFLQDARARRTRKLLLEPLLPAVAAALAFEPDTHIQHVHSEEGVFLRTGYLWAVRGHHPILESLRRLLPGTGGVADLLRSNRRLFDLVRETAFTADRHRPLDLEARIEALVAPYAARRVREDGLEALLVHLALWGDQTTETAADVVTLSTYHSAKGLEFERVLCTHVHGRAFPPYYARTDDERRESRRVLYVGMTRAMTHLVLTYPEQSRRGTPLPACDFLEGIAPAHAVRHPTFG